MSSSKEFSLDNIIDCHSHSGGIDLYNAFKGNLPMAQSVDDLVFKARSSTVSKVITFPFPSTSYYDIKKIIINNQKVVSGLQDFPYQIENSALIIGCKNTDFQILPFMSIDPSCHVQNQLDHLQNLYENYPFYGLKLHTIATASSAKDLLRTEFINFAKQHNIPILIHSALGDNFSRPENILYLAKQNPDLRICIAHMAGLDENIIKEVSKNRNLFIDTSPFLQICNRVRSRSNLTYIPNLIDPSKPSESLYKYYLLLKNNMIWGTDEPWTKVIISKGMSCIHTYQEEVDVLSGLFQISEKAVQDITTTNTKRFLFG